MELRNRLEDRAARIRQIDERDFMDLHKQLERNNKGADKSKFFRELLEGWDPNRYLDKNKKCNENNYRDSFRKFLDSKDNLMEHPREVVINGRDRVDLEFVFKTSDEEMVDIVEFKLGLDRTQANDLTAEVLRDLKLKSKHVYAVIIEDMERGKTVDEKRIGEIYDNFKEYTKRYSKVVKGKSFHIYIKGIGSGVSSLREYKQ